MTPPTYRLNRGDESSRLNTQHCILKSITGKLLPDHIYNHLFSLNRPASIADIGAGSGIWLVDLARELPADSRLDGYDFDISKFPSELPPNIELHYGNCLAPFPESLHGQYDCVHVRLLVTALKAEEWKQVATHLRALLRPGGWLIWDEMGHPCCTCLPMTEHFQRAVSLDVKWAWSLGRDVTSLVKLLQNIKDSGYALCTEQHFNTYTTDQTVQIAASKLIIAAFGQIMHAMVDDGGFEEMRTHIMADQRTAELLHDIDNGICLIGFHIYWISGQKLYESETTV